MFACSVAEKSRERAWLEVECLHFLAETVQGQFSVVDRGRKLVPEDWSV